MVELIGSHHEARQGLAQSRRVSDTVIAVLTADDDERVSKHATKEWHRRHREAGPTEMALANAREQLGRLGSGRERKTDDELVAAYREDPSQWGSLIRDLGAGTKLLRGGISRWSRSEAISLLQKAVCKECGLHRELIAKRPRR